MCDTIHNYVVERDCSAGKKTNAQSVGLHSWECRYCNASDRNATERDASLSYVSINTEVLTHYIQAI